MSDVLARGEGPNPGDDAGEPDGRPSRRRVAPFVAGAVALVLVALIVVAATADRGENETAATPLLGQPAPVVVTETIDGQSFDLGARRGSWVVLNFFSTWCRPCVEEHPELVRFATTQESQPDGAELFSVVFNDDVGEVADFFAAEGGDWPKLTDPDGRIQVAFGVAKSPETWIVDPSGVVRARVISKVSADSLTDLLGQLKAGTGA